MPETNTRKNEYARVKVSPGFIHPYVYAAKDGRTFEKAYVHLPTGTAVNGVNLDGYSCDVFLTDYMKRQLLAGQHVTVSFKADEPVPIWTGSRKDPAHPYRRFEVNAWDLVKGVKSANMAHAASRAEMQRDSPDVSLTWEAEASRDASGALANDPRMESGPAR